MMISAIYEHGSLRLGRPLDLADGTEVEIIVLPKEANPERGDTADILARIAALPNARAQAESSGRDHDAILYGPSDKP